MMYSCVPHLHSWILTRGSIITGLSECTSGFMERDLLERRASKISSGQQGAQSPNSLADNQLLVIPGMNFTCSGNITSLLLGVEIRDSNSLQADHLSFDIWRPVVENGQVTGYNWIRSSSIRIILQAGDFSSDGVIKYNIPMQNNVSFQNGDVIGVYQGPESRGRLYYASDIIVPTGYVHSGLPSSIKVTGSQLFNGFLLLYPVINSKEKLMLLIFLELIFSFQMALIVV